MFFEDTYDSRIGPVLPDGLLHAENGKEARVSGLVDTGCTITAVTPRVLDDVRLDEPFSQVEVWTPGGSVVGDVYFLRFEFTHGTPHITRAIGGIRCLPTNDDHQILIGRNILRLGLLTLDGVNSKFSFSIRPEHQEIPTPPRPIQIRRAGLA